MPYPVHDYVALPLRSAAAVTDMAGGPVPADLRAVLSARPLRRRSVLAVAAMTFPLLAAGCKGIGALGTPPTPLPDTAVLGQAITAEKLMIARYQAAISGSPGQTALLAPLLAQHRAHLTRLASRLLDPRPASAARSPSPAPATPPPPPLSAPQAAQQAAAPGPPGQRGRAAAPPPPPPPARRRPPPRHPRRAAGGRGGTRQRPGPPPRRGHPLARSTAREHRCVRGQPRLGGPVPRGST